MNREPKRVPVSTREWFSGLIHHIGKPVIADIWNVSHRTVELWAADKATTENTSKDPGERLLDSMDKVLERGKDDFTKTLADIFAYKVDCHLTPNKPVKADKATLAEELLDNIPVFAHYTQTMQDPNATIQEKRAAKRALFDEIEQDFDESLK